MHTEPSKHVSNPEIQYEKTDATVRPLYQFLIWISVITLLTAVISGLILRGLEAWREQASTPATMAEPQAGQQAPAPRLQILETLDLAAFRKEEQEVISTYGVVDREKGIYRIPIDAAMRLTLERGLPTREDPVAVPAPTAASPKPAVKAPSRAGRQ